MKLKKLFSLFLLTTLLGSTLLTGCQSSDTPAGTAAADASDAVTQDAKNTEDEQEAADAPDADNAASEDAAAQAADTSEATETKSITITVLNFTNISIGMFSVIDPVTSEQVNVDGMEPGESISLECNWPVDTPAFQWALYNQAGELCIDASTDITDANKAVALAITGDQNVDNVEVSVE